MLAPLSTIYPADSGSYVSAVHVKLIHGCDNNSVRKVKTDKMDAVRIADYGLSNWVLLKPYAPQEDTRLLLTANRRQYTQYSNLISASKNNFHS
nr:transposase [uncultured Clostridium sp.]